jgi:(2Fe-2S) ferredoxin
VSRKRDKRRFTEPNDEGPLVSVCRGCCCGTHAKHPDTDHPGQLAALRAAISGTSVRLRTTDCLDACARSKVVIVSPSAPGRWAGGRPVWLSDILGLDPIDAIAAWATAGGPGIADPPGTLDLHAFSPSRRVRAAGEPTQ